MFKKYEHEMDRAQIYVMAEMIKRRLFYCRERTALATIVKPVPGAERSARASMHGFSNSMAHLIEQKCYLITLVFSAASALHQADAEPSPRNVNCTRSAPARV